MLRPTDPLAGSAWSAPGTVAGFAQSPANASLMTFANHELDRGGPTRALDIGCGAGRNAVPLARLGWQVTGLDLSWPMLLAATQRVRDGQLGDRLAARGASPASHRDERGASWARRDDREYRLYSMEEQRRPRGCMARRMQADLHHGLLSLALAPMDVLPIRNASCDLVIAHGIWNLARSAAEFRRSVREAARVARIGAGLFVFTFSRQTLPPDAAPVQGEPFVFTQFSGEPQCFLTREQLVSDLGAAGFVCEPSVSFNEYNLPEPGALASGAPVIYEAAFRREP